MVEAIPPVWKEHCERCGAGFVAGEPRWIEQRRHAVHTECARWELWETPPYAWKLTELRTQYRAAAPEDRARIVRAGRAIRQMQADWPKDAERHVRTVCEAIQRVG